MLERPSSSDEPSAKRVRLDEPDTPTHTGPKLKARDVVELRFVRKPEDIDADGAAGPHDESRTFAPTFMHQVFPKEEIVGCSSATLAVYVDSLTLSTWIDADFKPLAGVDESVRTPLKKTLAPFIKAGLCSTRAEFESAVRAREPAVSASTKPVARYTARGQRFGVYKEKLAGASASALHKRACFFMFVHIDGASFIDADDPRWELFVVHRLDKRGDPRELVAYATIYPFAAMRSTGNVDDGFAERIRISQVFVMPPQQGRGHGARLLESVYRDAERRGAMEVTVEDPSIGFRLLRDLTDLRRAYKAGILEYKTMLDYEKVGEVTGRMNEKLLIAHTQARRCVEVHQLVHVDKEDEDAYKKYRLWVKRRLHTDFLEVLDFHAEKAGEGKEKEARKTKLSEIYADVEAEYLNVVERLDKRGVSPGEFEDDDAETNAVKDEGDA